jgi:hypothetical protein
MLQWRRQTRDLDQTWHCHLLCVPRIVGFERGVMYQAYGTDANDAMPHEGVALAGDWPIPPKEPGAPNPWGKAAGKKFSDVMPAYFRAAVHEVGHAFGLKHNADDNGFMNTTDVIAARSLNSGAGQLKKEFPDNIVWSFHPRDRLRLQHEPDVRVRPGTAYDNAREILPDRVAQRVPLKLRLAPLLDEVPWGAPVRVQLRLENPLSEPVRVPHSLSLKAGYVRGAVVDPRGTERAFAPLMLELDEPDLVELGPGLATPTAAMTLLRGPQGALFPLAGQYRVKVEVAWEDGERAICLRGETRVRVSGPVDPAHRLAALKIHATPEVLLSLALGGDHFAAGRDAITAAMNHPILKPHYAVVEATRLATRFIPAVFAIVGDGQPNVQFGPPRAAELDDACALLDASSVLSAAEINRLADFIEKAKQAGDPNAATDSVRNAVAVLNSKVLRLIAAGKLDKTEPLVARMAKLNS